jgi:CheY-like chemotaxis protein
MLAYSGKGRFYVEPVNLSEVVEEMTHMLEVSISKRAILRYNFAETLPAVEADVTQLRQVIMNLITNASEAIGDRSGVISVTTGVMHCDREYLSETYLDDDLPEGPYVYAEVADTGCGMDDEARVRLFEPFFTTKFAGRGLGLAAVLGIIRGHRGAIKVYSEPGKGTTVKVLLPISDQPVARPGDSPAPETAIELDGRVLLVDDEETVRLVASRMLDRLGFEVVTASNGREALEILEGDPDGFSCVLLDLTMPHMDGEETFREIRRLAPKLPVIISSGYNQQEVTQRFLGKGLAGFVQKPYQLASLLDVIRSAMDE